MIKPLGSRRFFYCVHFILHFFSCFNSLLFLQAVFALWKVPDLLPSFMLKGGEVSRFVIGGADLMFPGISIPFEGLPSFLSGEPWAIKVPGNPAPIAVSLYEILLTQTCIHTPTRTHK